MTVKVIWIARFRADIDKAAARGHWRDVHGVLGADVPGLDRYTQSHVVAAVPPSTQWPAFDGYSSGWYADDDAYVRSMASPQWAAIGADSDNLFDTPYFWGMSAFVDEHVVVAPPAGGAKVAAIVRFTDGGGERWVARTEALLRDVPGLSGAVLNVAGDAIGVEGRTTELALGFDGVRGVLVRGPDGADPRAGDARVARRAAGHRIGRRGTRRVVGGPAGASGERGGSCTRSSGW